MTDGLSVQGIEKARTISAIENTTNFLDKDSDSSKRIANELLKESENYSDDSQEKASQAREYLHAADAFEAMATAVRNKANKLKNNELGSKDPIEEVKAAMQVPGQVLEFPIPKDATPEELDSLADALENKAKENRRKADELLKQSEDSARLAKQLEEQISKLSKKGIGLSDLDAKLASGHSEGLNLVYKKLGINRLDNEYKDQIAASQGQAQRARELSK